MLGFLKLRFIFFGNKLCVNQKSLTSVHAMLPAMHSSAVQTSHTSVHPRMICTSGACERKRSTTWGVNCEVS